jgi:hypothetical protein
MLLCPHKLIKKMCIEVRWSALNCASAGQLVSISGFFREPNAFPNGAP